MVTRQIKSAQTQIEAQNAEIRKNVLKYDEVLNKQRQVIYAERQRVLDGEDLHDQVRHMIDDVVDGVRHRRHRRRATPRTGTSTSCGPASSSSTRSASPSRTSRRRPAASAARSTPSSSPRSSRRTRTTAYDRREEELGAEAMRELERQVLLAVIDRKWREHLYEMDYLQEGVGLRAYAQRDPLVEYQREGFDMFAQMMDGIKEEAVGFLFNLEVQVEEAARGDRRPEQRGAAARPASRTSRSTPRASARGGSRSSPAVLGADDRRRGRRGRRDGGVGAGPRHRQRVRRGPARQHHRQPSLLRPGRGQQWPVAQRALLLRLGQEVQALPRRSRRGLTHRSYVIQASFMPLEQHEGRLDLVCRMPLE